VLSLFDVPSRTLGVILAMDTTTTHIIIWTVWGVWCLIVLSCMWPVVGFVLILPFTPFIFLYGILKKAFAPQLARRSNRAVERRNARLEKENELRQRGWIREAIAKVDFSEKDALRFAQSRTNRAQVRDLDLEIGIHRYRRNCFYNLPAELRLEIYSYLDYGQALRLQSVSRFFRNDYPYEAIDREQRATYVYHAETWAGNKRKEKLGCYTCLRLLPMGSFSKENKTKERQRYGLDDVGRICRACEDKRSWVGLWRAWRVKVENGRRRLLQWKFSTRAFSSISSTSSTQRL
jgi:hypothetical protein